MDHKKIQTEHQRPMLKDLLRGDFKYSEIPTVTVKRYFRSANTEANNLIGSLTVSGTAALRLTYLNIQAATPIGSVSEFTFVDKDGTFDSFILGTPMAANPGITLKGDPYNPIHTIRPGTFNIYGLGTIVGGTYTIAFEGIQQ